jgi:hypothetical protein
MNPQSAAREKNMVEKLGLQGLNALSGCTIGYLMSYEVADVDRVDPPVGPR